MRQDHLEYALYRFVARNHKYQSLFITFPLFKIMEEKLDSLICHDLGYPLNHKRISITDFHSATVMVLTFSPICISGADTTFSIHDPCQPCGICFVSPD